jgi:hypothetical protein
MATATVTEEAVESKLDISPEALEEVWAQLLGADEVVEDDGTVRTTAELVEEYGRSHSTVRAYMRKAVREGKAERVKVRRTTSDGKVQPVPAYRLLIGEWTNGQS